MSSVRDHKQTARVCGDKVVVTSWVGRRTVGKFSVSLNHWLQLERNHPNPTWWKREHVQTLTRGLDDEPGGPDQADRIRDAQVSAINAAVASARSAS